MDVELITARVIILALGRELDLGDKRLGWLLLHVPPQQYLVEQALDVKEEGTQQIFKSVRNKLGSELVCLHQSKRCPQFQPMPTNALHVYLPRDP
jgi:hypothetical protein